jgi:hypothetical protein
MLGFRACNFQHVSLASGRAVFSSCGADPSKAKKRLSSPRAKQAKVTYELQKTKAFEKALQAASRVRSG